MQPTEIEKENKNPPTAQAPSQAAPDTPAHPPVKPSQAEKVYDWMVYDGLNYWTNLAISLYSADSLLHGWAKPLLEKSISSTTNALASTSLTSHATANRFVKPALRTLAFTTGGWAILVPMKWLEDNKRENVHWLQEKFFGGARNEHGESITPEQLCLAAEPPKQSWGNVLKRRIMATIASPTAGVIIDRTIGEKNVTNFVVNTTNDALRSGAIPYGQQIAQREGFQRYLSLAALDTLYCYITKLVMFYTNGTHGKNAKVTHEGIVTENVAPPCPPSEPKPVAAVAAEPQEVAATSHAEKLGERPASMASRLPAGNYADAVRASKDMAPPVLSA